MYAGGGDADTASGVLPSDDATDGGMTDASQANASLDAAPAALGSRGRKRKAPATAPSQQLALTTSSRGAAVNGVDSPAGGASGFAAQQKRGKSAGGSAEGTATGERARAASV